MRWSRARSPRSSRSRQARRSVGADAGRPQGAATGSRRGSTTRAGTSRPRRSRTVEPDAVRLKGSAGKTALRLAQQWAEGLALGRAPVRRSGASIRRRGRSTGSATSAGGWSPVYLGPLLALIVVRHATTLGYLSGRHALTLVAGRPSRGRRRGSGPGSGASPAALRLGDRARARRLGVAGLAALIVAGGRRSRSKAAHPSRWGHWAAGRWLAEHATPADAVLDTRGWAAFVSGRPGYDYWHVRQALTDAQPGLRRRRRRRAEGRQPAGRDAPGGARLRGRAGRRVPRAGGTAGVGRPGLPLRPARVVGGAAPMTDGHGTLLAPPGPRDALDLARRATTAPRCRPTSTRR